MKKFNLFKEIIVTNKPSLLQAINSSKEFGINIHGEIKYSPFEDKDILIYKGKHEQKANGVLITQRSISLSNIFGKNYKIVEDDDRVLIKAFSNWQELIGINMPNASYDDTTADGVAEFSEKELEDIGWQATEFNITYRDLITQVEDKCDGILLCIEQIQPYQFSGLGFIEDTKQAKNILFKYVQDRIKKLMDEDDDYKKENLTEDEIESAKFFKLI